MSQFANRSEEEIIKSIKENRNTDNCGVYELLHHESLKKCCFCTLFNIPNTDRNFHQPFRRNSFFLKTQVAEKKYKMSQHHLDRLDLIRRKYKV